MAKFFIDRNLGAVVLPRSLRDAGWDVITLSEYFGEQQGQAVKDEDWLQVVGENGWVALMKDKRIRYRPAEHAALRRHAVTAFCLAAGHLTGTQQAERFLAHESTIMRLTELAGPRLYVVSQRAVREVALGDTP